MPRKLFLVLVLFSNVVLSAYDITMETASKIAKERVEVKHAFKRDGKNNIVMDLNKKLMWQDDADAKNLRKGLSDAKDYCHKLTLGGFDDWHLPTIEELQTITDSSHPNPAINKEFKNVKSDYYISASPLLSDIDTISYMDFSHGHSYDGNRRGKAALRCVRGKQKLKF